ncbi:MAG: hypothetical protein ABJB61_13890 [bacterium]
MADPNKRELSGQKNESKERLDERKSDATSNETVSDLEEKEKPSSGEQGERTQSGVASPDGAFDEERETDKAGPM